MPTTRRILFYALLSQSSEIIFAGSLVGRDNACSRSCSRNSVFSFTRAPSRGTKQEVGKRSTTALAVMAHYEDLHTTILHGSLVELERSAIEPAGTGLLIVMEAEPNVLELADLGVVLAPTQINDVCYPQVPKLFGVAPGRYGASER